MQLKEIYQPIQKELKQVNTLLAVALQKSENDSILALNRFLLGSPGKRLRPALVVLSAKATSGTKRLASSIHLTKIAVAMELIHTASLIHDDVIDRSSLRHNRPTINRKFGQEASIALGDYLYSIGFELISSCRNTDVLSCITSATKSMCEGELIQVCERDNLELLRQRYLIIVKKKTAALFIASCQAGALLSNCRAPVEHTLKEYGLNLGIAFQVTDDCLDLISRKEELGKAPGADFRMGELTLPVLNLLSQDKDRERIMALIRQRDRRGAFSEIRQSFVNSPAFLKTKEDIFSYIRSAKKSLSNLRDSSFKGSLLNLADYVGQRLEDD